MRNYLELSFFKNNPLYNLNPYLFIMTFEIMAAPMENLSDGAYRELCYNHGADITFTEMTRLKSLLRNNASSQKKIVLSKNAPTIIQLLVANETDVETFLQTFKPEGNFKGFNLNMGCPSPDLIRIGQGCASIKRVEKTKRIVDTFKKHGYPISIKIRLGMNNYEKQHKIYLRLIQQVDADFFIVHARHGKQVSNEPADFSVYEECVKTGKRIIANGDIRSISQIKELEATGVAGVMVGRGASNNPNIFNELKGSEKIDPEKIKEEYITLSKEYNTPERYIVNILPRIGKMNNKYNDMSG